MNFDEEIRDFLIESNENLANLDREIVELEQNPEDMKLISSVFRTIHTIKGTCSFFGYEILGSLTHIAENILDQVREQRRKLTPELISLILEAVDQIKSLLNNIETTGSEGEDRTAELRSRLETAYRACGVPETGADKKETSPVTPPASEPMVERHERVVSITAGIAITEEAAADDAGHRNSALENDRENGKDAHLADSTIRVDVNLLNRLMNMVGELVLARNQLLQDAPAQTASLQKTLQRLNLITSELQEGLMKTRMQPVGVVWNKLPRVVRDLASKCGKKIQIELDGAATELDKTIIEAIKDPLTHIVRNSCDHGIETPEVRLLKNKSPNGTLLLRAYHEGGVVNLEISDDGAGIDPEKVKSKAIEKGLIRVDQAAQMSVRDALHLIFMPGFSTAAQITSISGRGVGMDVVKTNIEKIGGSVDVMNRIGGGTTIRIKIPLTLAIIPGLVVTLNGGQVKPNVPEWKHEERFIIPQASLLELVRVEGPEEMKRIESVHSTPVFHHRGKLLPLVYLGKVLGRTEAIPASDVINIIVLQAENRQIGLVVDRICDTQEIVVKPLGRQLKSLTCYVGATIMGDGRPALILDVVGLSRLAGLGLHAKPQVADASVATADVLDSQMLLLFRAGRHQRLAVPVSLVDRLEEVATSKIEFAAGHPVLRYRGEILPIVDLAAVLNAGGARTTFAAETCQLVVFSEGHRRVGVIVDQILDIVNETITVRRNTTAPGLLGSAVVGDRITDLIDLHALTEHTGDNWLDVARHTPKDRRRLLLIDQSAVAREMISEFLEMAGYDIVQASTFSEANHKTRQVPVDLVLAAMDLTEVEGRELIVTMQRGSHCDKMPMIGLLDRAGQRRKSFSNEWEFAAQVIRSERSTLLRSIHALIESDSFAAEAA